MDNNLFHLDVPFRELFVSIMSENFGLRMALVIGTGSMPLALLSCGDVAEIIVSQDGHASGGTEAGPPQAETVARGRDRSGIIEGDEDA